MVLYPYSMYVSFVKVNSGHNVLIILVAMCFSALNKNIHSIAISSHSIQPCCTQKGQNCIQFWPF